MTNVRDGIGGLGLQACQNLAGRALELLDLNAGLFGEGGGQLVGQTRRAGHIDGHLALGERAGGRAKAQTDGQKQGNDALFHTTQASFFSHVMIFRGSI